MQIIPIGKDNYNSTSHKHVLWLVEPMCAVFATQKELNGYILSLSYDESTETIYEVQRKFRQEAKDSPVIDTEGLQFIKRISGHKYLHNSPTSNLELARAFCKIARNSFESEAEKKELTLLKQFLFNNLY